MFNVATIARKGVRKFQSGFANMKLALSLAFVSSLALLAGPAMAQASDPAGAITSALSGLAGSVGGIIVLLAAALAVIILWRYVKKAS